MEVNPHLNEGMNKLELKKQRESGRKNVFTKIFDCYSHENIFRAIGDGMANMENEKCIELCIFMCFDEGWSVLGKRPFEF